LPKLIPPLARQGRNAAVGLHVPDGVRGDLQAPARVPAPPDRAHDQEQKDGTEQDSNGRAAARGLRAGYPSEQCCGAGYDHESENHAGLRAALDEDGSFRIRDLARADPAHPGIVLPRLPI
jgi:hypothetical protein